MLASTFMPLSVHCRGFAPIIRRIRAHTAKPALSSNTPRPERSALVAFGSCKRRTGCKALLLASTRRRRNRIMRAKPKNEPLADRRRLLPQTSARAKPRATQKTRRTATALKLSPSRSSTRYEAVCKSKRRRRPRHCCSKAHQRTGSTRSRPTNPATAGPSSSSMWRMGDQALGRVEVTLHDDVCPGPARTFDACARAARGDFVEGSRRTPLWYKGPVPPRDSRLHGHRAATWRSTTVPEGSMYIWEKFRGRGGIARV